MTMTDDFKSGKKYRDCHSDKIYKCIYVSPKGNAILQDEAERESFASRDGRDSFVEIIPEVVVVGYLRVDDAGHVSSFSLVPLTSMSSIHANSTFKPHYSVTFTNKGGEITAKIEKL